MIPGSHPAPGGEPVGPSGRASPAAGGALPPVSVEAVELVRVAMPLVTPFRTSFGTQTDRDVLLVRMLTSAGEGWGECAAPTAPVYSSEYTAGAEHVIEHHLLPLLFAAGPVDAAGLAAALAPVKGHPMARAALEAALLDAQLRAAGRSLAAHLGAVRDEVDCGVSVGIPAGGTGELLEEVAGYLADGYVRVKLKIRPGFDLAPVAAVRDRFGEVPLQVDANAAYGPVDLDRLAGLDAYGLLLVEQPFPPDYLRLHAELADRITTPVCLDETVVSAQAARDAVAVGACSVVNVKAGRVGGILEAVAVHDACAELGVPVWCGGMLETGVGRAVNLALAALPNMSLPGDTSASARYWQRDLTDPFVLHDGRLAVPDRPGTGAEPLPDVLAEVTTARRTLRPGALTPVV